MVDVGIVWVAVPQGQVNVPVRVRFTRRLRAVVGMLMVFVVDVTVLVRQLLVLMFVHVALRQMEVDSHRHQDTCRQQSSGDGFPENDNGERPPEERGQ